MYGHEHHHHGYHCCCPPRGHHDGCCEAGSGSGLGFHRRLLSREERVARLEAYLAELQAEARAVEERIAELRRAA
ncbi:hypothetical protein H5T53_03400 [Candidatus Bipolaricaulota bacterium]|nr:hypothetical protein [Candidatus Bipolaricaulota bacterium]